MSSATTLGQQQHHSHPHQHHHPAAAPFPTNVGPARPSPPASPPAQAPATAPGAHLPISIPSANMASGSTPTPAPATTTAAAYAHQQQHAPPPTSQPPSQQSFSMSQQPTPTKPAPNPSFQRSFSDMSSRLPPQDAPQIYTAVYSGTDVYEMEVNGIAVMRRRADGWLNATQILKVANIDKGKRTKILEKEIQTGEHEKVQGGYGKYQGTWIKFERGVEVCQQYGVEELLRPLLVYDMGQDGGVSRGDMNTPTKEQAMAAQRKRMYNASIESARPASSTGTFFKSISSTASQAVAAISKARFDSPGPRNGRGLSQPPRPGFSRQSSMQNAEDIAPNSQQSFMSHDGHHHPDSVAATQPSMNGTLEEPPRKRQRVATPTGSFMFGGGGGGADSFAAGAYPPPSPTEPNESFIYTQAAATGQQSGLASPVPPLPYEETPEAERARSQMMQLFLGHDSPSHEILSKMPRAQIDMPIDSACHSALHWAATLSRVLLLRSLVEYGGSVWRVNASGETPMMRACTVTNSHDALSFSELLDILGSTLDARDVKGRTVLHHIALTSGVKGRAAASKYYLESLLMWVVKSGSGTSQPSSQASAISSIKPPVMGLAKFMNEIVDARDQAGDTALNIAARIGHRSIIQQLLEVGADPNIPNNSGLKPSSFGIGQEITEVPNGGPTTSAAQAAANPTNQSGAAEPTQRSIQCSDDLIQSITQLLGETGTQFRAELKTKQDKLDDLHATLEATSAHIKEARKQWEDMQEKLRAQELQRQRIVNLNHAFQNELLEAASSSAPSSDGGNPSSQQSSSAGWETQLDALLEAADDSPTPTSTAAMLPSSAVLRARIRAILSKKEDTARMVETMRGRSREKEEKYRKVVALCCGVSETEVDASLDGLLKAVESEKEELEVGRVRKFLGSVVQVDA